MAGFMSRFFGSRQQSAEQSANQAAKPATKVTQPTSAPSEAYFLDFDQAQTMGNIDYMRTAKTVKRTFPKTVSQPDEQVLIQSVSANQADLGGQDKQDKQDTAFQANGAAANAEVPERRLSDSSLDMFRSMAKDLRKF